MNVVLLVVGIVIAMFGTLFALQGFGFVPGDSPMNDTTLWSVLGPIIAVIGVVIAGLGVRGRKS